MVITTALNNANAINRERSQEGSSVLFDEERWVLAADFADVTGSADRGVPQAEQFAEEC